MNRRNTLLPAVLLLVGMLGAPAIAAAHPVAQSNDPVSIAMAFAQAYSKGDKATLEKMLDPSFEGVTDYPSGYTSRGVLIELADGTNGATFSNCQASAPNTATCDATLTGSVIPSFFKHPYTERVTITVANGKITRSEETLSAQTLAEGSMHDYDMVGITMALAAAYSTGQSDVVDQVLDPSFEDVVTNPPRNLPAGFSTHENRAQFMAGVSSNITVALSNCRTTSFTTVACDVVLSGSGVPALAHPFTERITVTIPMRQITRLEETYSAQTLADMGGPAADIPATGSPELPAAVTLAALATLAALLLGLGVVLRRIRATRCSATGRQPGR